MPMPAFTRAWRPALTLLSALLLAACAGTTPPASAPGTKPAASAEAAPQPSPCPAELPTGSRCLAGRDSAGAHYLIALPPAWTGVLVLHAHGGPTLGPPRAERTRQDLQRWAVMLRMGHAWAGSTYRDGGVQVHAAAEDTERLRRIFLQHVAQPTVTVLHGQSWGASVAAVGAETYTARDADGRRPYDAVLLTSGVLAGGSKAYDFRLDLRVVYQALCHNHPLPGEPDYPLWMGLPPGSALTPAQLSQRARECLGLGLPVAQRSAEQQRRLKTIVDVIRIPERSVQSHLNWATWHFQDIVQHRTGGRNPFGNIGVRYRGSADDDALNAAVARYAADPQAVQQFAADTDPQGRIPVPVLTVHGIDDPTAFVEMDHSFRDTMVRAGTADHLVQTFTSDHEHSFLTEPAYATLMATLLEWTAGGPKPTPAQIAQRCPAFESRFGAGCRFRPEYSPAPLATRVPPR
ncbi:hypothetical protein [Aquabacterium sp.]|uniref:hypothetical protein n=1 Tax=Aquabacterium sp. TaxID=1872578 RepID=UPI0037833D35